MQPETSHADAWIALGGVVLGVLLAAMLQWWWARKVRGDAATQCLFERQLAVFEELGEVLGSWEGELLSLFLSVPLADPVATEVETKLHLLLYRHHHVLPRAVLESVRQLQDFVVRQYAQLLLAEKGSPHTTAVRRQVVVRDALSRHVAAVRAALRQASHVDAVSEALNAMLPMRAGIAAALETKQEGAGARALPPLPAP